MSNLTTIGFPGSAVSYDTQTQSNPTTAFTFITVFVLASIHDEVSFLQAWNTTATLMMGQWGLLSALLYRGLPDKDNHNNLYTFEAVWQDVDAWSTAMKNPDIVDSHLYYPNGTMEYVFTGTPVAVPGVCLGQNLSETGIKWTKS